MSQSKLMSATEAATNVTAGLGVAIVTQIIIFPWFGIKTLALGTHFQMGLVFTVVSLVRSYLLRRAFNRHWR